MSKYIKTKRLIPIVLIFILSFFSWKPLLNPGYFSMHDDQQVARLFEMDKAISAGQFPVRWVESLGFGYGYPLFNFYPPLAYYAGETFHLMGLGYIDSIKTVWFLALFGSALAMYFFAKEFFGTLGGLVSGIFYLYAPYHAVDAYVRGALAELASFTWLPLILLFSYKNKSIVSGIFLGLLMITHNLIFLPFCGIFIVWSIALKKNFVIPIAVAFSLTAFFWLPALWEKQFTLVDQILIKNLASYRIHFLCPRQLWYGGWGFGGSVLGCSDGLSFALGKIYFLIITIGIVLTLFKKSIIGIVIFGLLCGSLFMTLPYSQFVWNIIPPLWYLQFPWRFLEFAVLFSAFLAGLVVSSFKNNKLSIAIATCLILGVIFFNAKYFVPQKLKLGTTDSQLTSDYQIKWVVSGSSFEYLPGGVGTKLNNLGVVWVDIDEAGIANSKLKVISGSISLNHQEFLPSRFVFSGYSPKGAVVQVQITNFPGWFLKLDGKKIGFSDQNPYKLLTVRVPAGQHEIEGKFLDTPVRAVGNVWTVFSAGFLIIFTIIRSRIMSP